MATHITTCVTPIPLCPVLYNGTCPIWILQPGHRQRPKQNGVKRSTMERCEIRRVDWGHLSTIYCANVFRRLYSSIVRLTDGAGSRSIQPYTVTPGLHLQTCPCAMRSAHPRPCAPYNALWFVKRQAKPTLHRRQVLDACAGDKSRCASNGVQ